MHVKFLLIKNAELFRRKKEKLQQEQETHINHCKILQCLYYCKNYMLYKYFYYRIYFLNNFNNLKFTKIIFTLAFEIINSKTKKIINK